MVYLKMFNTQEEYEASKNSENILTISHCREGQNSVRYNPIVHLIVTYLVEDSNSPTQLYFYNDDKKEKSQTIHGEDVFEMAVIDGTCISIYNLDKNKGYYQLNKGEHIVKYILKDETKIGMYTFFGCESIINVEILDKVTNIGKRAFSCCSALTAVTIHSGVTNMGDYVFQSCSSLDNVTLESIYPAELGRGVFNDTNQCSIYVKCSSYFTYLSNSSWNIYSEQLKIK